MSKEYVLITGAYGGLGKALSQIFNKQHFSVVILGRDPNKLAALQRELSPEQEIIVSICDIRNWEDCQRAHAELKEKGIQVKVVINNAGITHIRNFEKETDSKLHQELMNTNYLGSVNITKVFLDDLLQNSGSIINISSVLGYAPLIGRTAYSASKYALDGFFSTLRTELRKRLHILMVYPTFIATPIRDISHEKQTINEILNPKQAATLIWNAFRKKKKRVFLGKTAKRIYYVTRLVPSVYINIMYKKIKKNQMK